MAVIKRIVILANSIKNSGRCLAGKELVWNGGKWEPGPWIRIVASEQGAEVPVGLMLEQFGRTIKLLDVIDIPLEAAAPLPAQPENWLLVRRAPWRDRGSVRPQDASGLVDYPLKLWGNHGRSVPEGFVQELPEPASLYFIEPEVVGPVRIWTDQSADEDGRRVDRHHRSISLRYRATAHEFAVTDPVLQERCYPELPERGEPERGVEITLGGPTYACISLTPPWHGKQYKIAAGFVRLEHTGT
jgi:hypothetical protein